MTLTTSNWQRVFHGGRSVAFRLKRRRSDAAGGPGTLGLFGGVHRRIRRPRNKPLEDGCWKCGKGGGSGAHRSGPGGGRIDAARASATAGRLIPLEMRQTAPHRACRRSGRRQLPPRRQPAATLAIRGPDASPLTRCRWGRTYGARRLTRFILCRMTKVAGTHQHLPRPYAADWQAGRSRCVRNRTDHRLGFR